jgi:replicative DNA helicase
MYEYNTTCQPPWSQYELEHKVDSATKQPGPRNYLRDVELANWGSVTIPTYAMIAEPTKKEVKSGTLVGHARSYLNKLRNGEDTLISLGLPEVDKMLDGGVAPGEMVLIGARPSHGKTAASMQSLHHWTAQGISSLLVSEEMGPLLLGKRTMQYVADIPKEQWQAEVEQLDSMLSGYEKLRSDCHVVESCGDVKTVVQQIEHHVKEHGVQCVVVDYAQKLEGTGKGRYEQATNVSIQLSSVAKRLSIVLLVLVQLSRKIEERKPFVPMPSDIKESGQFEQDADVVLFQVWPWKIDNSKPKEEYQFFCCKNRNREIQSNGFVKCRFLGNRQKFVSDKQFVATAMQHDFTPDEKVDVDFHNFD